MYYKAEKGHKKRVYIHKRFLERERASAKERYVQIFSPSHNATATESGNNERKRPTDMQGFYYLLIILIHFISKKKKSFIFNSFFSIFPACFAQSISYVCSCVTLFIFYQLCTCLQEKLKYLKKKKKNNHFHRFYFMCICLHVSHIFFFFSIFSILPILSCFYAISSFFILFLIFINTRRCDNSTRFCQQVYT